MQDYNSSAIHAVKRELFRAQAKSDSSNIEADRQSAFELDAGNPPAADVHFSDELLGESPALRVWADGASSDRAVCHLHGGGFIRGAPSTQRGMLGELSRSADAHVIALD